MGLIVGIALGIYYSIKRVNVMDITGFNSVLVTTYITLLFSLLGSLVDALYMLLKQIIKNK